MSQERYKLGEYEVVIDHHQVLYDPMRVCIWPRSLVCVALFKDDDYDILIKGSTPHELAKELSRLYVGIDVAKIAIKSNTYYVKTVGGELKETNEPVLFCFAMEVQQALDALHLEENVESFYQALVGMLSSDEPVNMYALSVHSHDGTLLHQHKYYYGAAGYQLAKCHAQYIVKRYQYN